MSEFTVKPAQILLVEDNPGDVQLTKEALENCKMLNTLHVVMDGEEAMEFLYNKGKYQEAPVPDIIILDLNLPKIDGREVLRRVKNDDKFKTIPIVILTTSKAEEDIIKSYEYHANCYITKPLDLENFIEVVKAIENFWMGIVVLPQGSGEKDG
ncbi:MAG: two-component system response regulator [Melioribacteraceae bacterium]|nr:MAG: two-component system response regulator [Melioribacteraceae bacterium]